MFHSTSLRILQVSDITNELKDDPKGRPILILHWYNNFSPIKLLTFKLFIFVIYFYLFRNNYLKVKFLLVILYFLIFNIVKM